MSSRSELRKWISSGRPCGLDWSGSGSCRKTILPDGRELTVEIGDRLLAVIAPLNHEMAGWSPEDLLLWQQGVPVVVLSEATGGRRRSMRGSLPAEAAAISHVTPLVAATMGAPDASPDRDAQDSRERVLDTIRRAWESEHGQAAVRTLPSGLELLRALPLTTTPLPMEVTATPWGPRLSAKVLAGDFVEPECREALGEHLLALNAHVALGGFAYSDDGSVLFAVVLPGDPPRPHVDHALRSTVACCGRFAPQIVRLATEPVAAEWWSRLNRPVAWATDSP